MTNANTRPEQIIDKNGKQTTVHKSNGKIVSTKNVERVSPIPPTTFTGDNIDVSKLIGKAKYSLHDDIFTSVEIARSEDGSYAGTSGFIINDDAFHDLDIDDLSDYLIDNEAAIKDFIAASYNADSVDVDPYDGSINVEYKISLKVDSDGQIDSENILDSLYETRGNDLYHDAESSVFGYGVNDFISATDTEHFQKLMKGKLSEIDEE